jgi:hypothetical protein
MTPGQPVKGTGNLQHCSLQNIYKTFENVMKDVLNISTFHKKLTQSKNRKIIPRNPTNRMKCSPIK